MGVDGLLEKNLVLDEALRVKKALQKRGYVVQLTRDTDIYIPLRERVNIARGYQADLFISLHANSNPDPSVSGFSVYTLSESGSDKEAAALARKENQSDVIAGVDLSGRKQPGGLDPDRPGPARHDEPLGAVCRDRGPPALPGDRCFAAGTPPLGGVRGPEGARCSRRPDRAGLSFECP